MKFSKIEKEHLLKAWFGISLAFALLYSDPLSDGFMIIFTISLLTAGIGFLLHEIAHKFVAQKYRYIAEFRSDEKMLLFAVAAAYFFGFLFAAPGAVLIHGRSITKDKNGKISAAGPATNIILAALFFGLSFFFGNNLIAIAFKYGFRINAFLALFNMLPFMNFDGVKILDWNKTIYGIMIAISGLMTVLSYS